MPASRSKNSRQIFPFLGHGVRPEAMCCRPLDVTDPSADQVIELAVRQPFYIEIHWGAFDFQVRERLRGGFSFPNRQRLEGVMVFFRLVPHALWAPPGAERIGKLDD